jgi:hypothetical protein
MDLQKTEYFQKLKETEELAEEIITDKAQVVDFDRKRNQCREAMAELAKYSPKQKQKPSWICCGDFFMKLPYSKTNDIVTSGTYLPHDQTPFFSNNIFIPIFRF